MHTVDPVKYAASFGPLPDFAPSSVPTCRRVTSDTASVFATLLDAPGADPFTGPDQAALEAMLRTFEPA